MAAQVIPWNFPLLMLAWKIAPALACGNTVVLKPAETTPLTALLFAEICQQADLPPGVVNIVTGAGGTGQALVGHPDVDKVAFTGSTEVGKAIARTVAGSDKRVTLELGGKAANIVFDDAPLDQAVEGIVNGIFFNQGHVCCAGSRLLVQESVADDVLHRLKRRMATLRVGDPLDKNTDVGAINSAEQLARIRELSDIGEAEGAERWSAAVRAARRTATGSRRRSSPTSPRPTGSPARRSSGRCCRCSPSVRRPRRSTKANNTPYGLSAGVWTDKGSRILQMANQLRAGVVWANTFNKFDPASPFGGYKESGYGREGGRHGLEAYLHDEPRRRSQDLQALHRRGLPALGVGPLLRGRRRQGEVPGQRRARVPQGRPRRRRRRPRRLLRLGRPHGVQPGPGDLPDRRGHGGPPPAVRRRAVEPPRGSPRARRRPSLDAAIDRLVWYAGWADKLDPGGRQREPGGRTVLQPVDARADRRGRGARAAGVVAARPGLAWWRR